MKMLLRILWYLGVLLVTVVLVLSFLIKSWPLTIFAVVLTVVLKVTNKHIPLPKVYQELGVRNEFFEGKSRSELKKLFEEEQRSDKE